MPTILGPYKKVRERLADCEPSPPWITTLDVDGITFHCIEKDSLAQLDLQRLRSTILRSGLEQHEQARMVQVVGDSGTPFADDQIGHAQTRLTACIKDDTYLEYGYTASYGDANWVVHDYLHKVPDTRSKTIANIVDKSVLTVQKPKWAGSEHVEHFVLLYSRDTSMLTDFGDDIRLSDGIMDADRGDMVVCFEGGPQAFQQCVNVLLHGIPVLAMTDLRPSIEPKRFSAARLLLKFRTSVDRADDIEECLATYPPRADKLLIIRQLIAEVRQSNVSVAGLIREG